MSERDLADADALERQQLQADLAEGLLKPETIAYSVTADGTITLKASVATFWYLRALHNE